jgi:hypothetical protein
MVTRVVLLVLLAGCRQLLGFESAEVPPAGQDAASDTAVDMTSDMEIDATLMPLTKTFQQGAGGYTGALDTYVEDGSTQNNATDQGLRYKQNQRWAMIQFGQLFVSQGGPIPDGAPITEATLTVRVSQFNNAGTLHEVLVPWIDTVTAATLGPTPGVITDEDFDIDAVAPGPDAQGVKMMNVRASLQAWSAAPANNHGWMFVQLSGGAGDSTINSCEAAQSDRPLLSVTYLQ